VNSEQEFSFRAALRTAKLKPGLWARAQS